MDTMAMHQRNQAAIFRLQGKHPSGYIWLNGQLPSAQIHQRGEDDTRRPAIIEDFIHGRANGTAAHDHVIDQDNISVFGAERQAGGLHFRVQPYAAEVVTVEGNIQFPPGFLETQAFTHDIRQPDTTGTNANERRGGYAPLFQFLAQASFQVIQQPVDFKQCSHLNPHSQQPGPGQDERDSCW